MRVLLLGATGFMGSAVLTRLARRGTRSWPSRVRVDDLTQTMLCFLDRNAPSRLAVDVVGPERLEMAEVVQRYRRWLGWRRAREARPPAWIVRAGYQLGDFAGYLGWRPPIRSNARLEPLPHEYRRLSRVWFAFGFPAFAAVLAIYWLMLFRPDLGFWRPF